MCREKGICHHLKPTETVSNHIMDPLDWIQCLVGYTQDSAAPENYKIVCIIPWIFSDVHSEPDIKANLDNKF